MKHVINWRSVIRRARPQPTVSKIKQPDWKERGTVYRPGGSGYKIEQPDWKERGTVYRPGGFGGWKWKQRKRWPS